MEKETTGIYISGHPMDDYRKYLRGTHVVPMSELMGEESKFRDDQIVSVAGIVQSLKMKSTRNNSMMAYVTVEDDTASMEMLAFSNVLSQYGGYLRENSAVVATGRLSDDGIGASGCTPRREIRLSSANTPRRASTPQKRHESAVRTAQVR